MGVAGYIQCAESEKYAAKNSLSSKLSFKIEEEIKSFPDKQKLKEFMTTKPAPQEILRGPFEWKKDTHTHTHTHTHTERERERERESAKATKTRKDQRIPPETPTLQATQWH